MRVITLTTDFGHQDWFAGILHGVILSRAPTARVVDLTHGLPRGDLAAAALALHAARPYFPPDSIHVVVVDPGVGSDRAPLAIRCDRGYLVGPDNGVFSLALRTANRWTARRIELPAARASEVSATFHGRDLFAPAAAWLAAGGRFARIGPLVSSLVELPWPEARPAGTGWRGEVIHLDTFGNALTNLPHAIVRNSPLEQWEVALPSRRRVRLGACYAAVPPGRPVVVPGSTGWLEIAVNGDNAARQLKLTPGTPVTLRRVPVHRRPH